MMDLRQIWGELRRDTLTRLFYALYIAVAFATFRHSARGFASIEGGSFWWGALSALAVDVGMMLSATGLRKSRTWSLVIGLTVSAVASTYTQWLYAVMHSQAIAVAPGAEWINGTARMIIDVRVLLLPALLPMLSVIYAFSAKAPLAPVVEMPRQTERRKATIDDWRTIRANLNGNERDLDAQRVATILEDAGFLTPSATTLRNWAKITNDTGNT